jgi:hypothetical protein
MKVFWAGFLIDCVIFLVLAYFFLAGLSDGTVGTSNIALWLPMICIPAAILFAGLRLKLAGRTGTAKILLACLAVPGILVGGFLLLLIVLFEMNPGAYR